jgi:hypothetical protein
MKESKISAKNLGEFVLSIERSEFPRPSFATYYHYMIS